ncbi:hypothetical protein [Streptomyces mirabilis]|uniref:hypothetical protein n=1 Tax=Streptomyces mirabilis TaxID=68239 RepID=UPI0036C632E7
MIEELEARESAARGRVEELEARIADLASQLEGEREVWSRLRIARETVAEVIADTSGREAAEPVAGNSGPETLTPQREPVEPEVLVVGAIMVPHWREGLSADVLPDVYRDIVEVVADSSGPMQAKQIVPRIGLRAVTGKIEGTRGKLKRLYVLPRDSPPIRKVRIPRGVGCGSEAAAVRGSTSLAARHPTTTRPPIGKCEQVAA